MKNLTGSGQYTVKDTNEVVNYSFTYPAYESLDDICEHMSEASLVKAINRIVKLDSNNPAREKAKVANGHSARKAMSEEEKAQAKVERQKNKAILEALKAKGLTLEDIASI